jgi:hypothetical protein
MSRAPIQLEPWPTEVNAQSFRVLSGEWSQVPGELKELGRVLVSDDQTECTFRPGSIWSEEGYFPRAESTFGLEELTQLCDKPGSYSPRSIYTHRLLQAMRMLLSSRRENAA